MRKNQMSDSKALHLAFTEIMSAYQEKVASRSIPAIDYSEPRTGKASYTKRPCVVGPNISDFICDTEIAAKRSLTSAEYGYFCLYYKSCAVVIETGDTASLQQHIDSFPEKYRLAVASIDNRVREKLGAHLLKVGIYPMNVYLEPRDVHGRKLKTKGKDSVLLMFPASEYYVGDISASAAPSSGGFLTPDEAAAYLGGLNSRTLTRWAREGYLPAIPIGEGKRRLWRFLRTDLESWMLARRQGGQNAA
jgi:excisionase family DNA binding protein